MEAITILFAKNTLIQAAANAFALISGIVLIAVSLRAVWNFCANAYHTSIKVAYERTKFQLARRSIQCANDINLYAAYLAMAACLFALSIAGALIGILGQFDPFADAHVFGHKYFKIMMLARFINLTFALLFLSGSFVSAQAVRTLSINVIRMRKKYRKRKYRANR
ncbi:hypothetical protein [Sphingomonas nostoxanthinifaciens]|uniref:hypothetical protein n=1 Tax=Sphingomonas nostoxanthinifaciens TaxID=2872652 RepID=UPI001CC21D4D|nr:hypothetical protein [Sphingomonas nostoxanthinifaciens]UAK24166.1 hypothetical protein K8P63_17845 [Sphingomonas nostoxanthinifaciens]